MEAYEVERLIARELGADEKLLWSGRPRQGMVLKRSDAIMIPFSLLWCGFAVYWEEQVITTDSPIIFKLWGIPFVLVGLYMVFGRFIADAQQRKRTAYAITSSRVIIVSTFFKKSVKSISLRSLAEVSLDERKDGSGTIVLGPALPFGQQRPAPPALEGIASARTVYDLLRRAQQVA